MKKKYLWPLLLIAVFAASRWPGLMPPNFSATYAIVFCAGVYLAGSLGWIIPLLVLLGSDLLLSAFYYARGEFSLTAFLAGQAPNYLAYAGLFVLGRFSGATLRRWRSRSHVPICLKRMLEVAGLVGAGLLGALCFYIVTNTAAWFSLPYSKTLAGWLQAITTGLPGYPPTWEFFRNTLLSGGLFTGLFAATMEMTETENPAEEKEEEVADEADGEPAKAKP